MFKVGISFLLILLSCFMISCEEDEDIDTDKKDDTGSRVVWEYQLNDTTNNFQNIPAVDEDGNLYFATNETAGFGEKGKFTVVSIDQDGNKRWEKVIENTRGYETVSYRDHKVFFMIGTYLTLESMESEDGIVPFATTYALDASTGDEIWKKEEKDWIITWPHFAVSDQKVYVYINDTELLGSTSKLVAYDITDGASKGEIIIAGDSGSNDGTLILNMTVANNNIYTLLKKGTNHATVAQFIDSGDVLSKGWGYDGGLDYEINDWIYYPGSNDLPIDDDGNIYFNLYYHQDITKNMVISLSKDGVFNWKHIIDTERISLFDSVSINKDGNIYFNISDILYSISSSGDSLWDIDKTYYDEYEILDAGYQSHPTIAENGNTYHHNSYGLVSVKPDGTIDWKYQNENSDIQLADYSTLLPNGNIIVMGTERIICFKGDGSPLATTNWPKVYGNNGNTSSK